jgi:hypothetical protein
LLKQFIFSISYQATLYILPSLFVNCVEVLILYSNVNDTTRKAYLIGKLVVVMLYPLSGGILLQPRRGILASFLGLSRNSNQINHEEHAKNNQMPKHVRHKLIFSTMFQPKIIICISWHTFCTRRLIKPTSHANSIIYCVQWNHHAHL